MRTRIKKGILVTSTTDDIKFVAKILRVVITYKPNMFGNQIIKKELQIKN